MTCLLFVLTITAIAGVARGDDGVSRYVVFDPSPAGEWKCGLTNTDLPGLATEGMVRPVSAACRNADGAIALVILSDISNARTAITAEQIASDSEDQLSRSWKVQSKIFEVRETSRSRPYAFARIIGKGDGFTLSTGDRPTLALSATMPVMFEDSQGKPRQVVAIYRVRSPLPEPSRRAGYVADLERVLAGWVETLALHVPRELTTRQYEITAAVAAGELGPVSPAPQRSVSRSEERTVAAALASAQAGRLTDNDREILRAAADRSKGTALGDLAASLLKRSDDEVYTAETERLLRAMAEASAGNARTTFAMYAQSLVRQSDARALVPFIRVARNAGLTVESLPRETAAGLLKLLVNENVTLDGADRPYFGVTAQSGKEILERAVKLPLMDDYADKRGAEWRLRRQKTLPPAGTIVLTPEGVAIVTVVQGTLRVAHLTNLLDAVPAFPSAQSAARTQR